MASSQLSGNGSGFFIILLSAYNRPEAYGDGEKRLAAVRLVFSVPVLAPREGVFGFLGVVFVEDDCGG